MIMIISHCSQHLISHFPRPPLPRLTHVPSGCSLPTSVRAHFHNTTQSWLAQTQQQQQLQQVNEVKEEDGPIELPPSTSPLSSSPLFADPNDPSPLQVATSVLLTGAISVFLFRSLRRRAKRAKELRFRSSGMKKKGLKEEALDSLKAMQSNSVGPGSPPSPAQALLGGLAAGAVALVLYKFTTTIEGALNRQTISDNFSVRQITITIRTIINGLCYLATFVFGINAIGLVLYSGQLTIDSLIGSSSDNASSKEKKQQNTSNSSTVDPADNMEIKSNDGQQTDEPQ